MMSQPFVEYRRASAPGIKGRKLGGVAVTYNAVADIGPFKERIAPGAFTQWLGVAPDILALADHDPGKVLARTRSKTLRITDTAQALEFELDAPDTATGRDMVTLAERGDLGGVSFGFIVEQETKDGEVRVVEKAQLFEISIVSAWPAYAETSVEARRGALSTSYGRRFSRHVPPATPRLNALQRFLEIC